MGEGIIRRINQSDTKSSSREFSLKLTGLCRSVQQNRVISSGFFYTGGMSTSFRPLGASYQQALLPACLLIMAGAMLAACFAFPIGFWGGWLLVGLLGWLVVLTLPGNRSNLRYWLGFAAFCLGGLWFTLFQFEPGPNDVARHGDQHQATIHGVLTDLGSGPGQWVLSVTQLNGEPATGRVRLQVKITDLPKYSLFLGTTLQALGPLRLPERPAFPGDFDETTYLRQQQMSATLHAHQITPLDIYPHTPWLWLLQHTDKVRQRIAGTFQHALPEKEGAVWAGIVLGDHAVGADPDVRTAFVRSGLVHLLAASGMNVGLIYLLFYALGQGLRLPLRVTLVMGIAGVAAYALLTGLPPSVQRAGTMLEIALLLKWFRREMTPLFLLALTGALLTLIHPMVVTMVGFQLSFWSTFGLLAMTGPLQEWLGYYVTRIMAGLILVPLVAQIWVTPILLYIFHQLPLLALPANILALPLAACLTYAGFLLGGFSLIWPQASSWLMVQLKILPTSLIKLAETIADIPGTTITLPSPPLPGIVLMMGLLLGLAYGLHHASTIARREWAVSLISIMLLVLLPLAWNRWQKEHQVCLTWLPSSDPRYSTQILQFPSSPMEPIVTMTQLTRSTARDIVSFCRYNGIARIALLNVLSPRIRRVEGLDVLARQIAIKQITFPQMASRVAEKQLIEMAQTHHIPIYQVNTTHMVTQAGITGTITHLPPQDTLHRYVLSPRTCLVSYWGDGPLAKSPLASMAQGCAVVAEAMAQTGGHIRIPFKHQWIQVEGFRQLYLSGR
jgi:ComEC/Rec2-related protein